MQQALYVKIKEALISVLPVTVIVLLLNLTPLLNFSQRELFIFIVSALFLILGIGLFNLGADIAMTPMGEHVGAGLSRSKNLLLLVSVCFIMGVLITVAEPDLAVLAAQVSGMMNGTLLIVTVGIGVGIFLVISILRIVFRRTLASILMFFYMLMFALSALVIINGNTAFLPMAYDSGGVTTGPITVPFIMALGVGIAATLGGKNAEENSFGLVALCSIGPILAVIALGIAATGTMEYQIPDYSIPAALGPAIASSLLHTAKEVLLALGLIVVFFLVLQVVYLKLPRKKLYQMAIGIIYTFLGLVIFLASVKTGFMPLGYKMGTELALNCPQALVPFGFVLGLVVVLAEPAVHVLNRQIEDVTDGTVKRSSVMIALSLGVGTSIGLSMLRIVMDFNILYYLIPGYFISLGLSFFVPRLYTAIAFDSGGVASGPLTSCFILPLAVGACYILQGEAKVMSDAFGIVAMVAMTPLITIQVLGFQAIATKKMRERITMHRMLNADDEQIITFM